MKKILVTGSSGLIGSEVVKNLVKENCEVYSCFNKLKPDFGIPTFMDLTKKDQIIKTIQSIKPEVIIHLGAFTDVELCEKNKKLAETVNTQATKILADELERLKGYFLYMSTDYVFDGVKGMYNENDFENPINHYGKTKLDGEHIVKNISSSYVIVRTSTPFGIHPKKISFPVWVKRNLELKKEIFVVDDQFTSPSFVPNISKMILEIIFLRKEGTINLAGASRISRYELARYVAEKFGYEKRFVKPKKISQMNWIAKRPQDSSLDVEKARKLLQNKPQTIQNTINEFYKMLV